MDKVELGKRIREARKQVGLTQEALAEKADIGVMFCGEIERGVKMPSINTFIKIVNALNISADYILRGEVASTKEYAANEVSKMFAELTPQQCKGAVEILETYIKTLK